ncbi:MAG: cobalamin biosynthesis protein [Gemmatales bacterium]|nr:MAG: cobalamin biosynthesis protein [Gemmatales bacterium]
MKVFRRVALVALTEKGIEKARQLRGRLRKGDLYRPEPFGPCQHAWEKAIGLPLSQHLPEWFQTYDQIVFFLAVGAVVRLIAPLLESKKHDPGVLAIDEQAHFVVPVLSGHEGGANTFARVVAGTLGATAVVTTATDATETAVLDEIAEDLDGIVEPSESWKQAAMALVQNHNAIIVQEIGRRGVWVEEHTWPSNTICLHSFDNMPDRSNQFVIGISDHLHGDKPVDLWIRPGSLVVGVGCERGISSEALDDGLTRFLSESGFCRRSVRRLATVDVKQDEQGLIAFAASNHWQLDFYTPTELSQVGEVPNPSLVVEKLMGCAGVAEPAALLAAGTSQLLVPKRVVASPLAKQRMTFALARLADFQEAGPATGASCLRRRRAGRPRIFDRQSR